MISFFKTRKTAFSYETVFESLLCSDLYAAYKKSGYFNNDKLESKFVLSGASIELKKGEFICLCGPNGGGKSSLLEILSGLSGKKNSSLQIKSAKKKPVLVSEKSYAEIGSLSRLECACFISFMSQFEQCAWDSSVLDVILTGRYAASGTSYSPKDFELAKEAADFIGISSLLDRSVLSLSGGEFQKVRIARAIAQGSQFLLLDEPCSALDISYEPILLEKLRTIAHERNCGVMISIHNINAAARFADKIVLLAPETSPISGSPADVFTEKNLSTVYKAKITVYEHPVFGCVQALV